MEDVDTLPDTEQFANYLSSKRSAENVWTMPWQELSVVLDHQNILSQRNLNIAHRERSAEFLSHCGFDLTRFEHRKQIEQFFGEAVFFIRHVLFTHEEREQFSVPQNLLHLDDPRRLLVFASQKTPRRRYLRLWSCALLKVMNAISHVEFNGKLKELDAARDIIFGKVKAITKMSTDHGWRAKSQNFDVNLDSVEWKEAKSRHSVLLKLLHKPEAMAEEVFDYLGVRFIVPEAKDIAKLLRVLLETDIIIPHQVLSLRSRNSLLNLANAQKQLSIAHDLLQTGAATPTEFMEMCEKVDWSIHAQDSKKGSRQNIHSSHRYKSIQMTVRHLVRTPNPAFLVLSTLAGQLRYARGLEPEDDPLLMGLIPEENARFFPLEIQIFDRKSHQVAQFGPASHDQYKSNQLQTVRKKILGSLLHFTEARLQTQDF